MLSSQSRYSQLQTIWVKLNSAQISSQFSRLVTGIYYWKLAHILIQSGPARKIELTSSVPPKLTVWLMDCLCQVNPSIKQSSTNCNGFNIISYHILSKFLLKMKNKHWVYSIHYTQVHKSQISTSSMQYTPWDSIQPLPNKIFYITSTALWDTLLM